MMKGSKIASNATYHKCIKELQRLGYLEYHPSFNPYSGTSITVHNFSDGYKSKTNSTTCSKNESTTSINEQPFSQLTEQVNSQPYIYNNKTFKNKRNIDREPETEIKNDDLIFKKEKKKKKETALLLDATAKKQIKKQKEKSSAKKEIPEMELVKDYFKFQEHSEFEAERFFNYYSSNGWLIGGKIQMKDWKASARNWMLNTSKFNVNVPKSSVAKEAIRPQKLHTTTDKNYDEPL